MENKREGLYKVLIAEYANTDITAEIPYLFKRAGCVVDVFCTKESWLLKGSYWDNWLNSEAPNPENFAKQLEEVVSRGNYDWVILGDDDTIRVMNQAITDPALAQKILPLSKPENRSMLGSKAGLSVLCSKFGILTPAYEIYNSPADAQALAGKLSFPLLIKIDRSSGGEGIIFCENNLDLAAALEKISSNEKNNLVFQKYIFGDNIPVEVLYKNGRLLAYAASVVLKTVGGEFSASMTRSYCERPEIEPALERMGRELGINGFGTITFIYNREEGQYYLLEADLRPQLWFRLASFCGVDFSKAISNYLKGGGNIIRPALPTGKPNIIIRHFHRELGWCIQHRNMPGLIKWAVSANGRWRFIPFYDKKLLWKLFVLYSKYAYAQNVKKFFSKVRRSV